ncbi:MAG: pilus assembly protein PilM, partial [Oscillospiraceae bacterium]|nr:pilus assembly protein PilM [Oscillospiraceae bacterium]
MAAYVEQDQELIFALDIGTRSIVGVVGRMVKDRFKVLAVESAEYSKRTMMDGQIDDIAGVAALARAVTERLEHRLEVTLKRVSVAAAGRALRTQKGVFGIDLSEERTINAGDISEMEAGAVGEAEAALRASEDSAQRFYLVGYTVAQYRLDNYPLTTLQGHSGKRAEADVVATFLPSEVVDSLYNAMQRAELQVASMTLEPIAAMNAAIPAELRLLNLALVDIGAGTSDIALCRDGSVVGYTMVTQAGDEVTEAIMKAFLVDFQTAEYIKRSMSEEHLISYTNILGLEERVSDEEVLEVIREPMERLAGAIAQQILEINGGAPSALFLAGGGSKLRGFRTRVSQVMGMEEKRVALVGTNFAKSAFSDDLDLNNPEYATPLGIAISAGMGLLNDSYVVKLNGQTAKL